MRLALVCAVVAFGLASRAAAQPAVSTADACGEAAFAAAEPEFQAFEGISITGATIEQLIAGIQRASSQAQAAAAAYEPTFACTSATWTVRALARQGRIYELLVEAIRTARAPAMPPAIAPRMQQAMEPALEPVRCLAVVRYVLAVRAARGAALALPEAIDASERLVAYGAAEVAQCVDDQRTHDSTFSAFTPCDLEPLVK